MRYPIRKTLLAACLTIASVAVATKTISIKDHSSSSTTIAVSAPAPAPLPAGTTDNANKELYNDLNLASNGMDTGVFELALKGFTKLADAGKITNPDKITI